tara:strand:- start:46 stop:603 length:558 start_codon:yes stop_codon:yes gene_type:complete
MNYSLNSTFLLTILLSIGLFFFLRASSKDRTTIVEVSSIKNPIETLNLVSNWLDKRGWKQIGGNSEQKTLIFKGNVESSKLLAIFLSLLAGSGLFALGLVTMQIYPNLKWWPMLIGFIGGPLTGMIYARKSNREEKFEFRLINNSKNNKTQLRLRAHRDELIAFEDELKETLQLDSDGSLYKTPI